MPDSDASVVVGAHFDGNTTATTGIANISISGYLVDAFTTPTPWQQLTLMGRA